MAQEKEKTNTGRYHVTKHPDGGWQVVLGGGSKVIRRTKTQKEAYEIAQEFAKNKETTVYLHRKKGSIREAASFKKETTKKTNSKKEEKAKVETKKTAPKKPETKKEDSKKTNTKKVETKKTNNKKPETSKATAKAKGSK